MTRKSNVRNITKFKRSVKAISPVIATLLMIAITVVAALVAYAWVSGYIGGVTTKTGNSIQIQSYSGDTSGNLVVYVQNVGQGSVQLNPAGALYINDGLLQILLANGVAPGQSISIPEGQTVALSVQPPGYYQGEFVKIKVVTTGGTSALVSGTGTSLSSPRVAGPAASLMVSGYPSPAGVGTSNTFTVAAVDSQGLTATSYAGTVHFTSTDASATLPANSQLTNGVGNFQVTFNTPGTWSITATDTVTVTITGVQTGISVTSGGGAGAATHFAVSGFPSPTASGTPSSVTVEALDASNNRATGYAGTVHISSSDGSATLPANGGLTNGLGSFSVTLITVGSQTIIATDTVTSSITGTQSGISVTAVGVLTQFVFGSISSPQIVGAPFTVSITAKDQFGATFNYNGNDGVVTDDSGTVSLSGVTFVNGVATPAPSITVTSQKTGNMLHVSAGTKGGDSDPFNVNNAAGVPSSLSIGAINSPQTVGANFGITVTVLDQYGVTYPYTGAGTLSDLTSTISPTSLSFSNGVANQQVSINTQTIGDKITASVIGVPSVQSNAFDVNTALTVTLSPTSWTMNVDQSKTFTATGHGGSGLYMSYQWYIDGTIQNGATAQTFSYSPTTAGTKQITATVTDSLGTTSAQSLPATVTVNSALAAPTVTATPTAVNQGQTSSLTSSAVSTGTSPYTYQWLQKAPADTSFSAIGGATTGSYSFVTTGSTATGAWNFELQVTDGTGSVVTSLPATVTVNSALAAPTVTATPTAVNQGQTSSLTSSAVSTGTSPYTYQWLQKAPADTSFSAIGGATTGSYSFVTTGSTATGAWNFELQVTDGTGSVVTSLPATVTVNVVAHTIILRPNGSGASSQNTANGDSTNWACVDEATFDTTTYVSHTSGTGTDTYAIQVSGLSLSRIISVTVHMVVAKSDVSTVGTARAIVRIGSTNYYSDSRTLGNSYVDEKYTWTTNPSTSTDWTWATINSMQAGVELTRTAGSSTTVRCTQLYVEINYVPTDAPAISFVLRPNGSGSQTQLNYVGTQPNYACVNEVTSDNDANYVYRNQASERIDTYTIPLPALDARPIVSVIVHTVAKVGTTGTVKPVIQPGGTGSTYGTAVALTGSYVDYTQTWTTNPGTSSSWTWRDIETLQIGVGLTYTAGSIAARCTQVWVEIVYAS